MKHNVLIIDDEKTVRDNLEILLSDEPDYNLFFAANGAEAKKRLHDLQFDTMLCDMNLPDISGFEVLKYAKENFPDIPVVIITAYSSWQTAREALKNGAFDFLAKPVKSAEIKIIIEKSLNQRKILKENSALKLSSYTITGFKDIIGNSQKMKLLKETALKIAPTNSTILITGDSGSGKELFATAIFQNSLRKDKNFVTVNCAAIPQNLLESELFGFVKGAFTGAVKSKEGYFEMADGGTLFLDEIGELPIDLQVKLLRVVEGHSYMRVGGTQEIRTDVRLIAATNRNLLQMINENKFRQDLYYRLAVLTLHIPPLNERAEDILELCNFFISKFNAKFNKKIKNVSTDAIKLLYKYEWKGNIRELQNVIEHAVLFEDSDTIIPSSFPEFFKNQCFNNEINNSIENSSESVYEKKLIELELKLIEDSLIKNRFNKSRSAAELGLSRQAFQYKINKFKEYFKGKFNI